MRVLPLIAAAVLLGGCQSAPSRPEAASPSKDEAAEIASEVLNHQIKTNGPNLLCSQPAYYGCFEISASECRTELASFNDLCMQRSEEKVGALKVGHNEREYGRYYALCLTVRHVMTHGDRVKEIGNCLKGMKYDKKAAARSLFE